MKRYLEGNLLAITLAIMLIAVAITLLLWLTG